MRSTLILISLLSFCDKSFAQNGKAKRSKLFLPDTAYVIVPLRDLLDNKIVIINVGEKAIVYLSGDSILKLAKEASMMGYANDDFNHIITFLDSAFLRSDTVSTEFYRLSHLEQLASNQLQSGLAKVFFSKENRFVDTISHRLERFGGNADRFFYLPNGQPFFFVMEMWGILDKKTDFFSGKGYQEYLNEGEKIASILKN